MILSNDTAFVEDGVAAGWRQVAPLLPEDLTNWRALDVGCGAGSYSFEMAKRGARVLGIDEDAHLVAQAQAAAGGLGLAARTEFQAMPVYDLASTWEKYDLVLFRGELGRLRYPLLAFDIVARKATKLLVFQGTAAGDEAMLRSCGLRVTVRPRPDVCACEPDPSGGGAPAAEFEAATGLGARLARTLHFKHCWVNSSLGYTETCYHDGTRVPAIPQDSDEYRGMAAEFGYGADTAALSREHEILHTFLAEALGYGTSPTLWAVAHDQEGGVAPHWEQLEEEGWTLAFQIYLHGGPEAASLRRFTDAGIDLGALREAARRLLR